MFEKTNHGRLAPDVMVDQREALAVTTGLTRLFQSIYLITFDLVIMNHYTFEI